MQTQIIPDSAFEYSPRQYVTSEMLYNLVTRNFISLALRNDDSFLIMPAGNGETNQDGFQITFKNGDVFKITKKIEGRSPESRKVVFDCIDPFSREHHSLSERRSALIRINGLLAEV